MKQTTTNQSMNLDLLRAIAVAAVFVDHIAMIAWHNGSFQIMGRFGVVLFFVHTSCVLMASLERMEASGSSRFSLTVAFWIRRLFRIYPLAIVCILTVMAFKVPSYEANMLVPYRWPGVVGFLSNLAVAQNLTFSPHIFGPTWTLPLEVQMYILLPFAYFALRNGRNRSVILWCLSLLPALIFPGLISRGPLEVLKFAPCFMAGVLAFDLIRSRRQRAKLPAWAWPIGIVALLLLFGPYDRAGNVEKILQCWGLALCIGLLYPFVREARANWFYHGCHWVAERSYGIYLGQSIVLWVVFDVMHRWPLWLQLPVLIAGVLGIPMLLYKFLEKPLIYVGRKIAGRLLSRARSRTVEVVA